MSQRRESFRRGAYGTLMLPLLFAKCDTLMSSFFECREKTLLLNLWLVGYVVVKMQIGQACSLWRKMPLIPSRLKLKVGTGISASDIF